MRVRPPQYTGLTTQFPGGSLDRHDQSLQPFRRQLAAQRSLVANGRRSAQEAGRRPVVHGCLALIEFGGGSSQRARVDSRLGRYLL